MKVRYDDTPVELTDRFIAAVKELMAADCEMMRRAEPEFADCWTWGRCHIDDLAMGPVFEYGGNEDYPTDGLGDFAIVS